MSRNKNVNPYLPDDPADKGVPLEAIRKMIGHEDDRTTLRNYCFKRLTKDQTFEKVAEALEKPAAAIEEKSVTPKWSLFREIKKAERPHK